MTGLGGARVPEGDRVHRRRHGSEGGDRAQGEVTGPGSARVQREVPGPGGARAQREVTGSRGR